jgi:hypothetical protein
VARLIRHVPAIVSAAWILLSKLTGFTSVQTRLLALLLTAAGLVLRNRLQEEP